MTINAANQTLPTINQISSDSRENKRDLNLYQYWEDYFWLSIIAIADFIRRIR